MNERLKILLFKNENEEFTRMIISGVTEISSIIDGICITETILADINLKSNDRYEVTMCYE